MKKTYILNPNMTFKSVNSTVASDKPAEAAVCRLPHKAVSLPPRQPLHTVTVDRNRPAIKLGLDVHLEFIMAVVQHDHQVPKAPRKFSPDQLITQVNEWIGRELARRFGQLMIVLHHRHDELQMHVQA